MRLKNWLLKYGSCAMAFALAAVATEMATRGCYCIYYQPKTPAGLKKFSKNK